MKWVGPIQIDALLDSGFDNDIPRPPLEPSVYIVSRSPWQGEPTPACGPLYAGGLVSPGHRFRTRIGDLVADMFGFFGDTGKKGHHSGGQSLYSYCREHQISPRTLYIGWAAHTPCHRCAEIALYELLSPELNKKRPPDCLVHASA